MLIGRLGIIIKVLNLLPLLMMPNRAEIYSLMKKKKIKTWEHVLTTVLLVWSSALLSIL